MTGFEAKVAKLNDNLMKLAAYSEDANFDAGVAKEMQAECDRLEAEIAAAKSFQMDLAAKFEKSKQVTSATRPQFVFNNDANNVKKISLGHGIVDTHEFKTFRGSVELPCEYKTTLTQLGLTSYDRPAGIVTLGVQEPVVADLIPQAQTSNTTVRLFVENSYTMYSAMVGENGAKPEARMDLVEQDFQVRKVAVLLPVTDELLSDHPAVIGYINNRLPHDIAMKEDTQILLGDGTGNNILGIEQTPGIQTVAKTSGSNADAIRHALALIQSAAYDRADGLVIHPLDWEILAKEKDANNQYYGGGPFSNGAYGVGGIASNLPSYWGTRVVVTTIQPQGSVLVGSFRNSAQIFRRMSITVDMSDSHGTTFAYNVKTIRAESRFALAVTRPKGFALVTGIA